MLRPRAAILSAIFLCTACASSDEASSPNYWQAQQDASGSHDASAPLDADETDSSPPDAADAGLDATLDATPDADAPEPCPSDVTCVTSFPFGDDRDTSQEPPGLLEGYSCEPGIDETGPEVVYRVTVPERGFLSAAVVEADGVDVDVHILSSYDASACLDRGNYHARADVEAGDYYVVVDTYSGGGTPLSGAFHVDIGFLAPSRGACAMQTGGMPRVGDNGDTLAMPATGPVVMEAHLVTQEEPPPYPTTSTEELAAHYALSQSRTGMVMHRTQDWAPLEGASFYGGGIGSPSDFPVLDEGWYVNMYWTASARPAKGTRMILQLPGTSRAVVVAAGYETGPGDLSNIGGTVEESHFYLDTSHQSVLTLGIAADQSVPLGPRECE